MRGCEWSELVLSTLASAEIHFGRACQPPVAMEKGMHELFPLSSLLGRVTPRELAPSSYVKSTRVPFALLSIAPGRSPPRVLLGPGLGYGCLRLLPSSSLTCAGSSMLMVEPFSLSMRSLGLLMAPLCSTVSFRSERTMSMTEASPTEGLRTLSSEP